MKTIELIKRADGEARLLHKIPDYRIYKQAKVRLAAYHGVLDSHLTEEELYWAKRIGHLPSRYTIHHIIPLCCTNTSFEVSNLAIFDREAHVWLHKHIYDPIVTNMKEGERATIVVPEFVEGVNDMEVLRLTRLYESIKVKTR